MALKIKSLRERFEDFVTSLEGFESIDKLLRGNDPEGKKRADYLLSDRSIIVEQKTLTVDPADRPEKFIQKLVEERGIVVYGQISTDMIFRKLPDGQAQKGKMFDAMTCQIDTDVANGDKQTRDTRDIFNIPDALGVLIILNENAKTLEPDIIRYGVQRSYAKLQEGKFRYPHNQGVIVISELHQLNWCEKTRTPLVLTFCRDDDRYKRRFIDFSNKLSRYWAWFNGAPFVPGFTDLTAFKQMNKPIIQLDRQQVRKA